MAVRSRRFFSAYATSVPLLVYTVPALRTAVIRRVGAADTGAGSVVALSVNGQLIGVVQLAALRSGDLAGYMVLNPGDQITVATFVIGTTANVMAFGSLLDGAPV